jgi:alanine racemase
LLQVTEGLEKSGMVIPLKHLCNSAATLMYPEMHLDMVRLGTILYGQQPAGMSRIQLPLQDPWTVKARIVHIAPVPAGARVGYGGDHLVRRPTRIATIPLGYVDGYTVTPSLRPKSFWEFLKVAAKNFLSYLGWGGPGQVTIRGQKANLVGRVGMQLCTLDIGHLPEVGVGDTVAVTMRRTTASPQLPRVYFKEGNPYKIQNIAGETTVTGELKQEYLVKEAY